MRSVATAHKRRTHHDNSVWDTRNLGFATTGPHLAYFRNGSTRMVQTLTLAQA